MNKLAVLIVKLEIFENDPSEAQQVFAEMLGLVDTMTDATRRHAQSEMKPLSKDQTISNYALHLLDIYDSLQHANAGMRYQVCKPLLKRLRHLRAEAPVALQTWVYWLSSECMHASGKGLETTLASTRFALRAIDLLSAQLRMIGVTAQERADELWDYNSIGALAPVEQIKALICLAQKSFSEDQTYNALFLGMLKGTDVIVAREILREYSDKSVIEPALFNEATTHIRKRNTYAAMLDKLGIIGASKVYDAVGPVLPRAKL